MKPDAIAAQPRRTARTPRFLRSTLSAQQKRTSYLFLLIPTLILLVFTYYPALKLVELSFTDWNGRSAAYDYVGLKQYIKVFTDPKIIRSFVNTFAYVAIGVIQTFLAFYLAIILNTNIRGRNFLRSLFIVPYVLNGVAVSYMFNYIYNFNTNPINYIKMPVMDGVELTKRLHTLYPNIRVIVLSGYDDYCFVRLSMKYGAFDYLLKPIDKHEFLSVVRLLQQSELIEQGKIEPNANSLINSAKNYIRKHYANKLTMVQAADYVHLNPSYFSKLFRSKTGVTFTEYLTNVRITQAKQLLLNTDDRICDICLNVGFSDNVTFNRAFRRVVGVSPTDYRTQFSFAECSSDADGL